jgi:AcrR family transcriptional regulator
MDSTSIQRGEQTQAQILEAAERLFLAQGFNGTSMRQIAREAGNLAVGGIYNHFASKEAIFEALLEARSPYQEIFQAFETLDGENGPELIRSVIPYVKDIIMRNATFFGLVMIDVREFDGSTMRGLLRTIIPLALQFARRVQALGGLRESLSELVLLRMLVMFVSGYILTDFIAFSDDLPFPVPDLPTGDDYWQEAILDVFMHGIAAQGPIP